MVVAWKRHISGHGFLLERQSTQSPLQVLGVCKGNFRAPVHADAGRGHHARRPRGSRSPADAQQELATQPEILCGPEELVQALIGHFRRSLHPLVSRLHAAAVRYMGLHVRHRAYWRRNTMSGREREKEGMGHGLSFDWLKYAVVRVSVFDWLKHVVVRVSLFDWLKHVVVRVSLFDWLKHVVVRVSLFDWLKHVVVRVSLFDWLKHVVVRVSLFDWLKHVVVRVSLFDWLKHVVVRVSLFDWLKHVVVRVSLFDWLKHAVVRVSLFDWLKHVVVRVSLFDWLKHVVVRVSLFDWLKHAVVRVSLFDWLKHVVVRVSLFDWLKHVVVRVSCLRTNQEGTSSDLRNLVWLGQMRKHQQPMVVLQQPRLPWEGVSNEKGRCSRYFNWLLICDLSSIGNPNSCWYNTEYFSDCFGRKIDSSVLYTLETLSLLIGCRNQSKCHGNGTGPKVTDMTAGVKSKWHGNGTGPKVTDMTAGVIAGRVSGTEMGQSKWHGNGTGPKVTDMTAGVKSKWHGNGTGPKVTDMTAGVIAGRSKLHENGTGPKVTDMTAGVKSKWHGNGTGPKVTDMTAGVKSKWHGTGTGPKVTDRTAGVKCKWHGNGTGPKVTDMTAGVIAGPKVTDMTAGVKSKWHGNGTGPKVTDMTAGVIAGRVSGTEMGQSKWHGNGTGPKVTDMTAGVKSKWHGNGTGPKVTDMTAGVIAGRVSGTEMGQSTSAPRVIFSPNPVLKPWVRLLGELKKKNPAVRFAGDLVSLKACLQLRYPNLCHRTWMRRLVHCQIKKAHFGQSICRPYSDCVNLTSLGAEFRTRPLPQQRPIVDRPERHEGGTSKAGRSVVSQATDPHNIGESAVKVNFAAAVRRCSHVADLVLLSLPRAKHRQRGLESRWGCSDASAEKRRNEGALGKREIPEKTCLPGPSPGTVSTSENPGANPQGIEHGSPGWEASGLTITYTAGPDLICTVQRYDGNTARLARRSDEALGVRVTVARIAPSLVDLGRAAT
ncbi:hypothetical protein PR048_028560 [Dryococelus australis]|uniref:Uncharacterized protein n=1 Tax=Dryococelus australis TaxID=614101 RepID=A0ABQ9GAX5_9NEOP|nr:hypothetical protein PR048_028560 [Dryococelus australis]